MDEIKWIEEGGAPPGMVRDVSEQMGGGALLIGGPEWVRTPPVLGGKKLYIQQQGWAEIACPVCGADGPMWVMVLEENLCLSCCTRCKQYGWFEQKVNE